MNIFRLLGELLVVYILYKVIFDFIIPLSQATGQMKGKVNDMQQKMQQQQRAYEEQQKRHEQETARQKRVSSDDYIDFEEVKS